MPWPKGLNMAKKTVTWRRRVVMRRRKIGASGLGSCFYVSSLVSRQRQPPWKYCGRKLGDEATGRAVPRGEPLNPSSTPPPSPRVRLPAPRTRFLTGPHERGARPSPVRPQACRSGVKRGARDPSPSEPRPGIGSNDPGRWRPRRAPRPVRPRTIPWRRGEGRVRGGSRTGTPAGAGPLHGTAD